MAERAPRDRKAGAPTSAPVDHVASLPVRLSQTTRLRNAIGELENALRRPVVTRLIDQTRIDGGEYFILPLFRDRQYIGYRVRIQFKGRPKRLIDVTGAASRYLPLDDARGHFDHERASELGFGVERLRDVRAAMDWDAPAESGNFAGGFAATSTQAARYARARNDGFKSERATR
jgi:hypothetical protein